MIKYLCLIALVLFIASCNAEKKQVMERPSEKLDSSSIATFAGGCFWCVESTFSKLPGVISVTSGYIGGLAKDANYERVSMGTTGHYEAIEIRFNPQYTSFAKLLEAYFREIDPTDADGQFADRGRQYKPAIFYHNDEQKEMTELAIKQLNESKAFGAQIAVEVKVATEFFPAEEYHQDYYKKNPVHYAAYRAGSGRQSFVDKLKSQFKKPLLDLEEEVEVLDINELNNTDSKYRKPSSKELVEKLSDMQYHVTQDCGTEPAFANKYWDNKEPGIYVDIVTGEPLFSSKDKYNSGTGWPSFTKPIVAANVTEHTDDSHGMQRVEVKSKSGNSHLGHVFNDGPKEKTGLRYCINSASLRFIPVADLEKEGYGEFKSIFD